MASRFLVSGGDGNWNSTSNWSATSGGASGASFPVAADDVTINSDSGNANITVNVLSACKSFICSSYTGTVTMNDNLSVNGTTNTGNITLSSGMTITGSGTFIKVPTGTTGVITSNGVVFDCNFTFQSAAATTTTITGAMQVNKNITWSLNSTAINTVNSGTISVGGDVIHNSPVAGTSTIQMIGSTTATITQVATRYLTTNLTINKTGIWNQVDLYWGATSRTLTYTSGIVNHTGTLVLASGTPTLNTSGMTWNTIVFNSSALTLSSVLVANNLNSVASPANFSFLGSHGFTVNNFSYIVNNSFTLTFTAGRTYTINNSIIITSTTNPVNWTTGTSVVANVNLGSNSFMKLYNIAVKSIAAVNKIIRIYSSTLTTCVNVFNLSSNINPYSTTR